MKTDDLEQFAAELQRLAATLGTTIDPPMVEGYILALEDLPINALMVGLKMIAKEWSGYGRFPRPAEIRKYSVGDASEAAIDAWGEVYNLIKIKGSYWSPDFDGPVREAVVACGGWKTLCGKTDDELTWVRKVFIENYGVKSSQASRKQIENEGLKQICEQVQDIAKLNGRSDD